MPHFLVQSCSDTAERRGNGLQAFTCNLRRKETVGWASDGFIHWHSASLPAFGDTLVWWIHGIPNSQGSLGYWEWRTVSGLPAHPHSQPPPRCTRICSPSLGSQALLVYYCCFMCLSPSQSLVQSLLLLFALSLFSLLANPTFCKLFKHSWSVSQSCVAPAWFSQLCPELFLRSSSCISAPALQRPAGDRHANTGHTARCTQQQSCEVPEALDGLVLGLKLSNLELIRQWLDGAC